jgi:hypothetical protein
MQRVTRSGIPRADLPLGPAANLAIRKIPIR